VKIPQKGEKDPAKKFKGDMIKELWGLTPWKCSRGNLSPGVSALRKTAAEGV